MHTPDAISSASTRDAGLRERPATASQAARPIVSLRAAGLALAGVLLLALLFALGQSVPSLDWLIARQDQVNAMHMASPFGFGCCLFLLMTVMSALALPGCSIVALAAGLLYGFVTGTAIVLVGSTLGATLTFLAARYLWRDTVRRRWGERLTRIEAGLARDGAFYLFSLRVAPIIPFGLLNPLMGLSAMSTRQFFFVSLLGMFGGSAVYVYAGTTLAAAAEWHDLFTPGLIAGLAGLAVLPWVSRAAWQRLGNGAGAGPGDTAPRVGLLFGYDWDVDGFAAAGREIRFDRAGFDLFSFPSNARLIDFDLERFAERQAAIGRRRGWRGVVSHNEQFGALAAALVAERLGLPGASPESVVAAQHKLHARRVLQRVAPEANLPFAELDAEYGGPLPDGIEYPRFVKPVKAAFSVLARSVGSRDELFAHTRFGRRELWVIRRLVEPFERVARKRLPGAGSAHRMMLEQPVPLSTPQFNLDGWVFDGRTAALGVVAAIMYPGTQAFMRWEFPSRLPDAVQQRALDVARRFLQAIGYRHGFFNMEFFHDPATDRLTVIEFNPRLASQFSDLYRRVLGVDAHAMSVELALGRDPAALPRTEPTAGIAASQVYRVFSETVPVRMPDAGQRARLAAEFPDALLFTYPKSAHSIARDFKWLGSYRIGIVHLGGRDDVDLRERTIAASALLGWTAPYADQLQRDPAAADSAAFPAFSTAGTTS